MNWTKAVQVGDEVSYADVNLWTMRGRLVSVGKGPHGADCQVQWFRSDITAGECLANLIAWK